MEKEYSALDVALWFIYKTNAEMKNNVADNDDFDIYEGITHLKLQKLLYFAQGIYLAINSKPLFKENILAWEHGPVVSEVYGEYKKYQRDCIPIISNEINDAVVTNIESDYRVSNALNLAYDNFAIYTAWQLRQMTHRPNAPWDITVKTKGLNSIIDTGLICDYFIQNVVES